MLSPHVNAVTVEPNGRRASESCPVGRTNGVRPGRAGIGVHQAAQTASWHCSESPLVPFYPRMRGNGPLIWRMSVWQGYLQWWTDESRSRIMTGEELRRIVLKQFYDRRTTEYFTPMHALVSEVVEGNSRTSAISSPRTALLTGMGMRASGKRFRKNMERGVNVIEDVTTIGSSQTDFIGKLIAAVDRSNASEQEKKQAKILLEKLANNGLVMTALGTLVRGGSTR